MLKVVAKVGQFFGCWFWRGSVVEGRGEGGSVASVDVVLRSEAEELEVCVGEGAVLLSRK